MPLLLTLLLILLGLPSLVAIVALVRLARLTHRVESLEAALGRPASEDALAAPPGAGRSRQARADEPSGATPSPTASPWLAAPRRAGSARATCRSRSVSWCSSRGSRR